MDLHTQIIKAVQKHPKLYAGKTSLAQREMIWQKISKELSISEQVLRTRWHFLRNRFRRELRSGSIISYKKQLEFLLPYMRIHHNDEEVLPDTKLEFVITEKDLASNAAAETKIEFIELEELGEVIEKRKYKRKVKRKARKEKLIDNDEVCLVEEMHVDVEIDDCSDERENNDIVIDHDNQINIKVEKTDTEQQKAVAIETDMPTFATESERPVPEPADEEEILVHVDVKLSENTSEEVADVQHTTDEVESEPKISQRTPKTNSDEGCTRSEDVIFGELVTAMLTQMTNNRKRNIKKEIMNLLLS